MVLPEKRSMACALAISGAAFVAAGPAAAQSPVSGASAPRPPEAIYAKTCGYCHGQHVAPVIRGRKLPTEMIVQFVRSGPAAMPAFRPTEISDVELAGLARWIRDSKADPEEHAK